MIEDNLNTIRAIKYENSREYEPAEEGGKKMTRDKIIEMEDKMADAEARRLAHLARVMDIGFLLGSGKTYEDWLEMNKNKKESE